MTHANNFLRPTETYVRHVDPIRDYIDQTSLYLHKMTQQPLEQCQLFVTQQTKLTIKDPVVTYYERQDNGDKFKTECRLSNYISQIVTNQEILAPTGTTYLPEHHKKSLIVDFVDSNVKARSVAKKEAFKAKADNNTALYILKNNEQNNKKMYNNSMSGAFGSSGNPLKNPTGHSTLTSIVRSESSISNASNEKIISGNRHYYNADVILNNCIYIVSSFDKTTFTNMVYKYNLYLPSIQDTINVIKYSSDLYFKDFEAFSKVEEFICILEPIERAAICYIGDLYHVRKFNDSFTRTLLENISRKITDKVIEDPIKYIESSDEQVVNYAHQICMNEVRGIGKDYSKLDHLQVNVLAATVKNIIAIVEEYKDFIGAIFLTDILPSNTAYVDEMIRRTVVLSDTDSTMFSVDEWVNWYFGSIVFTEAAMSLASSIMFIATQCIAHSLAMLSANIGVARDKLFKIAMKPEFCFPVFAQTSVAKHYFTMITVREGNVYNEPELEVKGVHLKSSAAPKEIITLGQAKMKEILFKVANNEKISIVEELKLVADLERKIEESLLTGNIEYYKLSKVKNKEAYSKGEYESPYVSYLLWNAIFESKYGTITPPPYRVIKIPTLSINTTSTSKWLDSIEDRGIAKKIDDWLAFRKRKEIPTLYLPVPYVRAYGIPIEVRQVIDTKAIILELTKINRMVLEVLGYFPKEDWLISEMGY